MFGEKIKMSHKKEIVKTSFQHNKPALRLAYNLLHLACSRDNTLTKKLTREIIQSVFSLIGLIKESVEKNVFKEPLKFLNKVYSNTAVLYEQIKIFRESGYLSESDFIDYLDKITAMKYEFNALLLHCYGHAPTADKSGVCKTLQGRQPDGIALK